MESVRSFKHTTISVTDMEGKSSYLEACSNIPLNHELTKWLCKQKGISELAGFSKKISLNEGFSRKTKDTFRKAMPSLKIAIEGTNIYEVTFDDANGCILPFEFSMMGEDKPNAEMIYLLLNSEKELLAKAASVRLMTLTQDGEYVDSDEIFIGQYHPHINEGA